MKKCAKYFLVMLGLMIGFIVNANAVQAATLNMNYSDYWYYRAHGDGSDAHSWHWTLYEVDGEVAYCIEPNIPEGTSYTQGTWEQTGLPNSIKERILLIGYYGYTYPGHQSLEYRAATQGLIWDTIVGNGAHSTFWTERWRGGSQFNVSSQQAEIERLISHHYDRPSFNGGVYKLQVGETLTLTDTNNVLGNYSVSVNGADYNVDGNKLTIKPTKDGAIDITLTKKMPYNSGYKFFVGDGIQNMYVPGTTDPVIAKIRVNSYYGDVELTKKDKETNQTTPQGQATLKNAEYGVYEQATGKLVTTIKTDENGYGKSPKVLPYNSYYLQEINASEGYLLDNTKYNFDLKGKENEKLDVFETVVKNYISILKQYEFVDGETTFLNAEKGITFEIYYPNGNKFDEITTDKNGYATINLPYGVWKFHQVNSTTGYEKIYDFFITVDYNSEKEQYYNILNNALSAYLQVFKTDIETGKTALEYLIQVRDYTFIQAVETILGYSNERPPITYLQPKKVENIRLILPKKSATTDRVISYLSSRGIDKDIISECIDNHLIYEDLPNHNVVFVGYDKNKVPRYAGVRATNSSRYMKDAYGSHKAFSFKLDSIEKNDTVHLFESAIDLLSYATLNKLENKEWYNDNLLSLAGVYQPAKKIDESKIPLALSYYLNQNQNIKKIYLHFDNDSAGRIATMALKTVLPKQYEVIDDPPKVGKDFNDFLCAKLGINYKKRYEKER